MIIGIKISAQKINNMFVGYWCYTTKDDYVHEECNTPRKSRYDAEKDAIISASAFSVRNNITFITEGYTI